VVYASVLYLFNRKNKFGNKLTAMMFVLRTVAVALIAFLLLNPLARSVSTYREKPVAVMALDNSASMQATLQDSAAFMKSWEALKEKLSDKYELRSVAFADGLQEPDTLHMTGPITNINKFLNDVNDRYPGERTAAVVIATDGIHNRGVSPGYAAFNPKTRLIAVGVGSEQEKTDLVIQQIRNNEVVYAGNEFPVEVLIRAKQAAGKRSELSITKDGKKLASETVDITNNNFTKTFDFYLAAEEEGLQEYVVSLSPVDGEENTGNNSQSIFMEVVDEQSEILILAHAPHPDVFAMKSAIETKPRYAVSTEVLKDFEGNLNDYDLVILHQLPAENRLSSDLMAQAFSEELPLLFVLGQQTAMNFFSSMDAGVDVDGFNGQFNYALPALNEDFALFKLSATTKNWLNECPPLAVPFGDYSLAMDMKTMLYQQLDNFTTSMPLVALSDNFSQKTGVIAGTGLWKWRMRSYVLNKDHRAFDEWFYSIARYLAISQDKDFFRVFAQNKYAGGTRIIIRAELYNASYELDNTPEVRITLTNKEGEEFEYLFDRMDDKYELDLGSLSEGVYQYTATTELAGNAYEKSGAFVVSGQSLELLRTVSDFDLLRKLSSKNNGFFTEQSSVSVVADSLLADEAAKPVLYSDTSYSSLLNKYWLLAAILLLLSLEWFLRKYNGGY
jgi:hypothetical protein